MKCHRSSVLPQLIDFLFYLKAIQILINLLNGLNRSVPHIEVMCIIFDVFISLAEYHDTRPKLAKMELVYDAVLTAMTKGTYLF